MFGNRKNGFGVLSFSLRHIGLAWNSLEISFLTNLGEDELCWIGRKIILTSHALLPEHIYQDTLALCSQQTSGDSQLLSLECFNIMKIQTDFNVLVTLKIIFTN